MIQTKLAAQQAIEDAALTIGKEGTKDLVFALTQVQHTSDHVKASLAITGTTKEIVSTIVEAMREDDDFRRIMLSAISRYTLVKVLGIPQKKCGCADCIIDRALHSK